MTSNPDTADLKLISWKYVILISIILSSLKIGAGMLIACHIGLMLWALLGINQAIQALSMAVVVKYLNPVLYVFPEGIGVFGWVVIILGGCRLLIGSQVKHLPVALPLIGFSLFVATLIVVQDNKAPAVSVSKLLMFAFLSCAVMLGSASLTAEQVKKLDTWFGSLILSIVMLSLPTFLFPEIAYAKNGQGFQGILNHPQTFGPVLAPTATSLLASVLFCKPKYPLRLSIASLALMALMLASQARTALATVFLSLAATTTVVLFRNRKFLQFRMSRFMKVAVVAISATFIVLASSSTVQEKLTAYVYKRSSANMDQALSSRSEGIQTQWENFLEAPLTGFGFGVYRWGLGRTGAVEFMGLPISAPVEKGFLPTAILEEIGIFGALGFLAVLIVFARQVITRRNARWLAIFFSCIFVNVGEMGIFSVGGIGLFYWLMIGVATRVSHDEENAGTVSRNARKSERLLQTDQFVRPSQKETVA